MTSSISSMLFMLLGAVLLASGFLLAALADRIRGARSAKPLQAPGALLARGSTRGALRVQDYQCPTHGKFEIITGQHEGIATCPQCGVASPWCIAVPKIAATKVTTSKPAKVKVPVMADTDEDLVVSALVSAGYKKPIAASAARACTAADRDTIERWIAAALRNAARGIS